MGTDTQQPPPLVTARHEAGEHPRRSRRRPRRLDAAGFALTLPAAVYFVVFFVAPVALVTWYSFGFKPGLFGFHDNSRLSLDRYREALNGPFLPTFENTLRIAVTGTGLTLLIGVPFAYALAVKAGPRVKPLLLVLVLVPFWCNFLVRTLGWRLILSPDSTLSVVLQHIGVTNGPLDVLDTWAAVQIGVVYNYLPLMILPLYVAFDRLDPALREASKDLGANRLRTLLQVTLPLAMPGIATGCLLVFVPLMGDYITASVLGGAKGNMVGILVASWFQDGSNWALGSAEAVLLIVSILATAGVAAVLGLIVRGVVRRRRRVRLSPVGPREESASATAPGPRAASRDSARVERMAGVATEWALRSWPVVVYVFLFLPIAYVVAYSFNNGRLFASWSGFGVGAYRSAVVSPQIVAAVVTSLKAAVGTALLATVLGTLTGLSLARHVGRWSKTFTALLALVLVAPEIMLAVAELPWFVSLGVDHGLRIFNGGIVRLVVSHSLFSTAVVAFIVRARMTGLDASLEEAAADLYAPPWRRFTQITLPLMMPAVVAGAMMAFTLSLDDVILSSFVSVQGQTPWPVYIFSAVRSGLRPNIAAMSTIMLAVTLLLIGAAALVLRRGTRSSGEVVSTMTGTG